MTTKQVTFELNQVYEKQKIKFHQAKAISIHPQGDKSRKPFVAFEYTSKENKGRTGYEEFDYLINATGPKLKFEATEGLDPAYGYSQSVCTFGHAEHAWNNLPKSIGEDGKGRKPNLGCRHR